MSIRVYQVNPVTGERREVSSWSARADAKERDRLVISEAWPPCRCSRCQWGEGAR
jgi:hypothetical protein